MSGFEVDTSLAQAAFYMLQVLLFLSVLSLVVAVLTLPLFFAVLYSVSSWFWALDEAHSGDSGRGPLRRLLPRVVVWAVPIIGIGATVFMATYFFGGSGEGASKQASWGKLRFDEVTRSVAEALPRPPAGPNADPDADPVKQTLPLVRALSLLCLLSFGPFPAMVILLTQVTGRMGPVLIIRSLSRNLLRTGLTYLAIFVFVCVITFIFSILTFLAFVTSEKESNLKAIITERNQIPSQMKPSHENELRAMIAELPPENRPKNGDDDIMTWAFVGGSLDPKNRTSKNSLFLFCMEPKKLMTMMDGLDELTGEQRDLLQKSVNLMEANQSSVVLGKERLAQLDKKVGDEIEMTSFNYTDMVFKFKIVGIFPEGRYDQSAIMHRDYLKRSLEDFKGRTGKEHPLADKSLNLIWVRMPDRKSFEILAEKVNASGKFNPAVKMETASSAIGAFLEPMKDILWAIKWLLVPAMLATMTLVIANAISISVRERRIEMAVLKVLGFRPWMVMCLVLGEAVLIGALSGFMATATAFALINGAGGIPFPIAFFPKFFIPAEALWWGPFMGTCVAILGSIMPSWTARSVKVSEVFSKVA